ncbi:MAG: CHAT domain-containing protein [Acidobacteriota bacterium]
MRELRVLIIEDSEIWQEDIFAALEPLHITATTVTSIEEAALQSKEMPFDLITVDLNLRRFQREDVGRQARELVEKLELKGRHRDAGVLIVTGTDLSALGAPWVNVVLRARGTAKLLLKKDFKTDVLLGAAREVLREAQWTKIEEGRGGSPQSTQLDVYVSATAIQGYRLSGERQSLHLAEKPQEWDPLELGELGNLVGETFKEEATEDTVGDRWRPAAVEAGRRVFEALGADEKLKSALRSALKDSQKGSLRLQLIGPLESLAVPFELLHDGSPFPVLNHVMSRSLSLPGTTARPRSASLVKLLRSLADDRAPVRALLLGAGSSDEVRGEIAAVKATFDEFFHRRLGLPSPRITALVGGEATPEKVEQALVGCHFFHYAGHGFFEPDEPERSGLLLSDPGKPRIEVSALDLHDWLQESDVRFAFLNCCVSAKTAAPSSKGDFRGVIDALIQARVPWILGHRWGAFDFSSEPFARLFYGKLWQSLSPDLALLGARRLASRGALNRNDPIWASPILVCQGY